MAIGYKINIMEALQRKGVSTSSLQNEGTFGGATMHRIRKGNPISWATLERLCDTLDCEPGDLLCRIYYKDGEEVNTH